MKRIEKEDVSVGSGIISSYKRMPQKIERVFAEFIDNSTQSFKDHEDKLFELTGSRVCRVNIVWNDEQITIEDNAFGMNIEDFRRALKLNDPKAEYTESSRSQYGMGLKIAASYLGDWYSIESTMYGNDEKYFSIVDIADWRINNPKEIDNEITDVNKKEHYTKITIKNLDKKLNVSLDKTLRKKLAAIYYEDLSKGDLELILNGINIIAVDPELRENTETGSEYIKYFDDSFIFNNETYEYSGWIGILKVASTDNAGFTISQFGRGIILNYRPGEIFGKSNSYQYQRIVGEIELNDKKWNVSFNKDNFIWDDGLEKAFLESLSKNKDVVEIKTISGKLRKDVPIKPIVKPEDIKKTTNKMNEKYQGLKNVVKVQVAPAVPDKPVVVIKPEEKIKPNIIEIEYESIKYIFDVQVKNDDKDLPWLNISRKEGENSYYIIINGLSQYFASYSNKDCRQLIIDFAITLALAELSSVRIGGSLETSALFLKQINEIIKNAKDKKD